MSDDIYQAANEKVKSDREFQLKVLGLLTEHSDRAADVVMELDARLSRINLQTNGAAAIAILAFIGSGVAPKNIVYALLIFVVGVIAAGIQVRFQHMHTSMYLDRLSAGRKSIREGEFKFDEAMAKSSNETNYDKAEKITGVASQILFGLGVIASTWIFVG